MLTTALLLAVALNLEPTRAGVSALILAGPNPIRRLWAFLCGIVMMGLLVGLLVLFVFHRALVGHSEFDAAKVQIGIGVAALVIAAIIGATPRRSSATLRRPEDGDAGGQDRDDLPEVGFLTKLATHSARITSSSPPWVLFTMGLACSLPSIDFMAMLLLIAASEAPAVAQIAVLLMFLIIGNSATVIPLLSYRIAPAATLRRVEAFQSWIRSRTRRDVALIVAALGLLIIAAGVVNL